MEQETAPELLFVIRANETKVRGYRFIKELSNGKYLYEEIEHGFKECFLHADIFTEDKYQRGYSNSNYKEQDRNKKVRIRRRKGAEYGYSIK